jgi:Protein of unknown function (DUF2934)
MAMDWLAADCTARDFSIAWRTVMSAFPFGPSFDSQRAPTEQMRGRRSREKKLAPVPVTDPARRHAAIAEAAYYRAERRRFAPGHELDDWLQAEAEVARRAGRAVRRS